MEPIDKVNKMTFLWNNRFLLRYITYCNTLNNVVRSTLTYIIDTFSSSKFLLGIIDVFGLYDVECQISQTYHMTP